jgi:anti-anti-sigma factor
MARRVHLLAVNEEGEAVMSRASMINAGMLPERRLGSTAILTPPSDLRELEFEQIETAAEGVLREVAEGGVRNVVIDFRETDFYGSTALAFFVKLWKRVRSMGGRMAFCNVSPHEREILEITRLNTMWPLCDSLEEALRVVNSVPDTGSGDWDDR